MTLDDWVAQVSAELGVGTVDVTAVLDLARDVAHGVARPAAPLTCLLVGLAARDATDLPAVIEKVHRLLPDVAPDPAES
jgi:Domain of unknown function (DUF6457)